MSFAKAQDNKKRTGIGEWCDVRRHAVFRYGTPPFFNFPVLSLASHCESIAKLLVPLLPFWLIKPLVEAFSEAGTPGPEHQENRAQYTQRCQDEVTFLHQLLLVGEDGDDVVSILFLTQMSGFSSKDQSWSMNIRYLSGSIFRDVGSCVSSTGS